jgi:hypothetical protein
MVAYYNATEIPRMVVARFEISKGLVIPKRGLAAARNLLLHCLAVSRFLADKPGFGMTRGRVVLANCTTTRECHVVSCAG